MQLCVCRLHRTGWSISRLGCCAGSTTCRRWTRSATYGSDVGQHGQTRHSASGRPCSVRFQAWAMCPLGAKTGLWLSTPPRSPRAFLRRRANTLPLTIQAWRVSFNNSFTNSRSRGRRVKAQRTNHAETLSRVSAVFGWSECIFCIYRGKSSAPSLLQSRFTWTLTWHLV